jgi:hypothetical protein
MANENPFKGCASYEDGDQFYGRESEIREIESLIKNETLTLLFSRSGIGKSSIIKAGIFPALKNDYEFFPIYIRLNDVAISGNNPGNLCDFVIKRSIESLASYFSTKQNFRVIHPENSHPNSLFEFVHNLQIIGTEQSSNEDDTPMEFVIKPVLFFDQFEEIFTQPFDKNELQYLLTEIRCLLENEIPAYLKEDIINASNPQFVRLRNALKSKQKGFRIVFAFREEYLPHFESLRNEIPSIRFTNSRYRLEPFTIATATQIIVKTDVAITEDIACKVAESVATQIDQFDDTKVDPFLLSLICQIIYPDLLRQSNASADVRKLEIKSLVDNAIESYIQQVYKSIDDETKKFIEKKLITSDGKKNSVNLNDVAHNTKLKNNLVRLAENPNYRLLNIGQFLDSQHVSLLHDRLLPPLIKRKQERKAKEDYEAYLDTQKEWKAKKKKQQIYFFALLIGSFFLLSAFYIVINSEKEKAQIAQRETVSQKQQNETQKQQNLYLIGKAETLNKLASDEHRLALIEKNKAVVADSNAIANQKKFLGQKKLTDSIYRVKSDLQELTTKLQKSYDSNLINADLTSHNINYFLDRQASMLPLIFNRLIKVKESENEERYQQLLAIVDSTVNLTYKYSKYLTNSNSHDLLEAIKNFWNSHKNMDVVDSILTGFLNSNLYYQQKVELDDVNNTVNDSLQKSTFVFDQDQRNNILNFSFAFNKSIYSGTADNDARVAFQKNGAAVIPGSARFKEKFKNTIGLYTNVIFSPDSTYAVTYSDNKSLKPDSIILWNLDNKADTHILKTGINTKKEIKTILFSKQSKKILVVSQKGVSLFDPGLAYKEVILNHSIRVAAANFSDDEKKIIGVGRYPTFVKNNAAIPLYLYNISIPDFESLKSNEPEKIGSIPYGISLPDNIYSVSLSPDESQILLKTDKGLLILNAHGNNILETNNVDEIFKYRNFYSSDNFAEAAFLRSNAIVAIGDSANVYVFKIYPDFKNADEALHTVKTPPLSLIDSLKLNPANDTVYNKILSSYNKRNLSAAARYYFENYFQSSCFQCSLLKSKELYKRLLSVNENATNSNNTDAFKLIATIKLLSALDNSYQNKEAFYTEIIAIADKYKNSQSQHDLSIDFGNLAFYSLFVKKFDNALDYAIKGLQLDSTNDYIYTNLALGYLFTNQFDKAEEVYNRFKDKIRFDNQTLFKDSFKQDFRDLETNGIINESDDKIYEEVEKIKNVLLN